MKVSKTGTAKVVLLLLLILGIGFNKIIELITDFLWFQSIELTSVFMVRLMTKVFLFLPLWAVFGFTLVIYLRSIYKSYQAHDEGGGFFIKDIRLKKAVDFTGVFIGGLVAYYAANQLWMDYLRWWNGVAFGQLDPIFFMDIQFYVFTLPFLREALQLGLSVLVFLMMATAFLDLLFLSVSRQNINDISVLSAFELLNDSFFKALLKKISHLLTACFLILGGLFYLETFELLYSPRGVAFGASYTDMAVTLWALRAYAVLAVLAAVLTAVAFKRKKIKVFLTGPAVLLGAFLLFSLAGVVVQQLVVEPDEISKESPYLVYNIEHTQQGFGLDRVGMVDFPYDETLDLKDLATHSETVNNIKINDARPLKQTYNQIQGIRLYYDFNDIDTDRYVINGEYTQVFVAPRELNQFKLDNKAMTWLNQHLKYTHGHGLVMSPVNAVTKEGQPELIFKNIPPVSSTNLVLNKPEIYFGERTDTYIITNTDEKEFDYPSGSDNVETVYTGKDGVALKGLNRFLFALRERSFKLLVSNNIHPESKIIIRRSILERVNTIAPFLQYDSNPYIVLNESDGKLYWIVDAYTETPHYPYSQRFEFNGQEINYIRNAVKVVVDAYEGTIGFYVFDETDPLIQTYQAIYPELFKTKSDFPVGLVTHIRYPQDYFDLQSLVYRSYHVDNPVVFYNGEDVWDIALEKYMEEVQTIESNYVMFEIEDKAEFALILPYTPKAKPNMTSLLVARNDGEHYGELFLYRFPKDKTIQGPIMIESRIDQDSTISPQFTLWGQQGSKVLRGNVIVVPIESSLLYIEPIYLQADNAESLPEMKRVIVAYANRIVMAETLDEAILKIFGEAEVIQEVEKDLEALLEEIDSQFGATQESLDELQRLIDALREKIK